MREQVSIAVVKETKLDVVLPTAVVEICRRRRGGGARLD